MDPAKIAQIADRDALRNLMANAKRLERDDIYWLAFKRLCSLEGMAFNDPLERDFYDVLRVAALRNGRGARRRDGLG